MKLLVFALVAYVSTQTDLPSGPNVPPTPDNLHPLTTASSPTSKPSINPSQAQAPKEILKGTNALEKPTTTSIPVPALNSPNKEAQGPITASSTSPPIPLKTVTNKPEQPPSTGIPHSSTQVLPKDQPISTSSPPLDKSTQAEIKVEPSKTTQDTILPTATDESTDSISREDKNPSSSISSTEEVNDLIEPIDDHVDQSPPKENESAKAPESSSKGTDTTKVSNPTLSIITGVILGSFGGLSIVSLVAFYLRRRRNKKAFSFKGFSSSSKLQRPSTARRPPIRNHETFFLQNLNEP